MSSLIPIHVIIHNLGLHYSVNGIELIERYFSLAIGAHLVDALCNLNIGVVLQIETAYCGK